MIRCKPIISIFGISVAAPFLKRASFSDPSHVDTHPDPKKQPHDVALYLTPDSKKSLQKHLSKLGIKGDIGLNQVVIRRHCSEKDSYPYEPLFGERAAFRLKGIVRTDSGTIAGTGRVSMLSGELRDDRVEVSLPLEVDNALSDDYIKAIDLPTRISKARGVHDKPFWKGRLIGGDVLGRHYGAEKGSFVAIPREKQIVVDGYLCSSVFVDEKGNCLFDRASNMSLSNEEEATKAANKALTVEGYESQSTGQDSGDECPVCRYMKAGPCREQFLAWDSCITALKENEEMQKCFDVTMHMMECMREHEYYDMLTAGTEDKFSAVKDIVDAGVTEEHGKEKVRNEEVLTTEEIVDSEKSDEGKRDL